MTSHVRYKPANIFFALVRLWAVRLSKNELDTIFSNIVDANIKDSTTTIHIEKKRARAFFCRKTDDKFQKWEFLARISSKGLTTDEAKFCPNHLQPIQICSHSQRKKLPRRAQPTIYQGFEKAVTGVTGKTVLLHRPTAIAHRAPRHR